MMIAEPAARELGVELRVDERLIEFDFGPIEGMTFDDVIERDLPFPWGPRAAYVAARAGRGELRWFSRAHPRGE